MRSFAARHLLTRLVESGIERLDARRFVGQPVFCVVNRRIDPLEGDQPFKVCMHVKLSVKDAARAHKKSPGTCVPGLGLSTRSALSGVGTSGRRPCGHRLWMFERVVLFRMSSSRR